MILVYYLATAILVFSQEPSPAAAAHFRPTAFGQLVSTKYTVKEGLPAGSIAGMRFDRGHVLALTTSGVYQFNGAGWGTANQGAATPADKLPPRRPGYEPRMSSRARTRSGDTWAVNDSGAIRVSNGKILELPRTYKPHQPVPNIDSEIRYVTNDNKGQVWIATDHGLLATDGDNWWHPLDRTDGMPYEDMLCVTIAPNGDIWGGTTEGAWRLRNREWNYFWGERWLPGNRVNSIAFDDKGVAWLATDKGVARIEEKSSTLAEKAAHYEEITAARHNRRGFVTSCRLLAPGDPTGGFVHHASDNDGLWTALYICAESFRYGATKSPDARALAKKSMAALLDLVRMSGVPGFPARAIIRKGENVDGYDPSETVRVEGEPDKIWYTSPVDPNIIVKGDTSSDELDGHYMAWYVYHDIVADEKEKKELQKIVRAVTTNILDHKYTLVGHTGRKTRWGVFGPQFLNDDPRWWDERGLNSAEMLCYLKVAIHICGDKRFKDAYEELIDKHHYLINTLNYRKGANWYAVNHSDDELAFAAYYPLLMLEKEPHRRAVLLQAVGTAWKGLRDEHASLYNFIWGAGSRASCDVEESVKTLQEWPWDLIDWSVKNSHRNDVSLRVAPGGSRNKMEIDRVLPPSERQVHRWNSNPYDPDGGNPISEEDGTAFLLPYWMGRYHKLFTE